MSVDGDEDPMPLEGEADRDGVRGSRRVGGREPGDALAHEEGSLFGAQGLGRGLHLPIASLTFGITSDAKRRAFASACSCVIPGSRPQKQ